MFAPDAVVAISCDSSPETESPGPKAASGARIVEFDIQPIRFSEDPHD
jgi:hypothetical protein